MMKKQDKYAWLLAILCVASLFLFLGEALFNTRGEPREAVVALSMLQDGNWVLPVNNGVDMAYKPPLFHWCIALFSTIAGGVSEYTSACRHCCTGFDGIGWLWLLCSSAGY